MTHNEGMDTAAEGLKIGRTVKGLRHKKQITLQDLAARTGIPKSVLAEIESAKEYLGREYFKLQGRFRYLTDKDLDQIQEMVNEDWELLLRKAGERLS